MNEEIKIYVADLAAYNNGKLHGVWIDATQELDDIQDQINEMLAESPEELAEEWAIHDYEGFGNYSVSEYEGIQSLHEIACFIEEHGEIGSELLGHFGDDLDDAKKAIEENYSGCYASLADYAQELTESTGDIPKHLEFYIDYERMGRDMELSGDIFTIETALDEVLIFWAH
jgi:antirestriction protein